MRDAVAVARSSSCMHCFLLFWFLSLADVSCDAKIAELVSIQNYANLPVVCERTKNDLPEQVYHLHIHPQNWTTKPSANLNAQSSSCVYSRVPGGVSGSNDKGDSGRSVRSNERFDSDSS